MRKMIVRVIDSFKMAIETILDLLFVSVVFGVIILMPVCMVGVVLTVVLGM